MISWSVVVKEFAPGPALLPFVRAFEIVETKDAVTRTLLPDTGLIIGFRYSGCATLLDDGSTRPFASAAPRLVAAALSGADPLSSGIAHSNGTPLPEIAPLPSAAVTGLRTSARLMHTSANGGVVLAKFRAAGAAPFFNAPLHRLFGLMRPLDEVIDSEDVAVTSRRIADANSDADRLVIFEQFLLAHYNPAEPDPIVSAALRAICAAAGVVRVAALARDLGISQDTLEKRFRRIAGASPKQFASIVRLRHAIELSRHNDSLTTLALDAGYYDQSHFNRDFRAITGTAPSHFFAHVSYC